MKEKYAQLVGVRRRVMEVLGPSLGTYQQLMSKGCMSHTKKLLGKARNVLGRGRGPGCSRRCKFTDRKAIGSDPWTKPVECVQHTMSKRHEIHIVQISRLYHILSCTSRHDTISDTCAAFVRQNLIRFALCAKAVSFRALALLQNSSLTLLYSCGGVTKPTY